MINKVAAGAYVGVEGALVTVEVDASRMPGWQFPDADRESADRWRERLSAAIQSLGSYVASSAITATLTAPLTVRFTTAFGRRQLPRDASTPAFPAPSPPATIDTTPA